MGLFSGAKTKRKRILTKGQMRLLKGITQQTREAVASGEGFGLDPLAEGATADIGRVFGQGSEFGRLSEEAGLKLLRGEQLIPYSDPGREQFYQEAFLNPAMANFQQDILPDLAEQYAGRGLEPGRSGDFLNAGMTAGRRLATDLGAQRANLLRQDQERALIGAQIAPNVAAAPSEIAFNTGQQRRYLQNQFSNPAYGIAPLALGTQPFALTKKDAGFGRQLAGAAVSGATTAAMMCWVADVLWGETDARTLAARRWVQSQDTEFTREYRENGKVWAEILRCVPSMRVFMEPIWLDFARKGGWREAA